MTKIPVLGERKNQANQGIGSALPGSSQERALLEEFSDLLDKIASCVGTANEIQAQTLSGMLEVVRPKPIDTPAPRRQEPRRQDSQDSSEPKTQPEAQLSESPAGEVDGEAHMRCGQEDDDGMATAHAANEDAPDSTKDLDADGAEETAVAQSEAHETNQDAPTVQQAVAAASMQGAAESPESALTGEIEAIPVAEAKLQTQAPEQEQERTTADRGAHPEIPEIKSDKPVTLAAPRVVAQEEVTAAEQTTSAAAAGSGSESVTEVILRKLAIRLRDQKITADAPAAPQWGRFDDKSLQQLAVQPAREAGRLAAMVSMMKAPLEEMVLRAQDAKQTLGSFQTLAGAEAAAAKREDRKARAEDLHTRALTPRAATQAMERVEQALKEVAKSKDGKTISVRLDPAELGSVKVDVSMRDGVLHARLMADATQVTQLLREKAADLQAVLRRLGLHVDSVTVAVVSEDGRGEQGASFGATAGRDGSPQGFPGRSEQSSEGSVLNGPLSASIETVTVLDHWVA